MSDDDVMSSNGAAEDELDAQTEGATAQRRLIMNPSTTRTPMDQVPLGVQPEHQNSPADKATLQAL